MLAIEAHAPFRAHPPFLRDAIRRTGVVDEAGLASFFRRVDELLGLEGEEVEVPVATALLLPEGKLLGIDDLADVLGNERACGVREKKEWVWFVCV